MQGERREKREMGERRGNAIYRGTEIRGWCADSLDPVEHDQARVAVAHEDLAEDVDAMVCWLSMVMLSV